MEFEKIRDIVEKCSNDRPREIIQHLNSENGLVQGIIENLPNQYTKQMSHPVCSMLFELYRSGEREAQNFVLQFAPVLVWIYLSATSRRDKEGYGQLEAILLAIYNAEVMDNKGRDKTFRLPSLSRPSMYHEPSIGNSSLSALTESALSRHEQSETPIILPGPNKQLNRITAGHRMSVLCVVMSQYNSSIALMSDISHRSYCIMALRVAIAGFAKLCRPGGEKADDASIFSNDELTVLSNHPRIPLVAPLIQQLVHGLYYLMYNGQPVLAATAVRQLNFRAAHGLLAPAHVLTNAVHHSLSMTGGIPVDGPLGLQVHLLSTDVTPPTPTASVKTLELPESSSNLVALTTHGMETKRSAVQSSDHHSNINVNGLSSQDEVDGVGATVDGACATPARGDVKTHKKSSSTGHWKMPFRTPNRGELELVTSGAQSADRGRAGGGKLFMSDQNLASDSSTVTLTKVVREGKEIVSDTSV